jgi:hypothetical protein
MRDEIKREIITFFKEVISNKKIDLNVLIKILFTMFAPFGFVLIYHIDEFLNVNIYILIFLTIIYAIVFLFVYNFYLEMRRKITNNIIEKQSPKFIKSKNKLILLKDMIIKIITNINEILSIQNKNILIKKIYGFYLKLYNNMLVKIEKFIIGIENIEKKVNASISNRNQNIKDFFSFRNLSSIGHFDLLLIFAITSFMIITYIQNLITTIAETTLLFIMIFIFLILSQIIIANLKYFHLIFLILIYENLISIAINKLKKQNIKFNKVVK